jgi:hypothetical protein
MTEEQAKQAIYAAAAGQISPEQVNQFMGW